MVGKLGLVDEDIVPTLIIMWTIADLCWALLFESTAL
jgi:hypothetical protein